MTKINPEFDDRELRAWCDWKSTCAFVLCTPESQNTLAGVAARGFRKFVEQFSADQKMEGKEAFGLLETHAVTKHNGKLNKSYKDSTFYKVEKSNDPTLQVVRGQIKGMMKDVVRKFLVDDCGYRREDNLIKAPNVESIQAPKADDFSLEQVLTDHVNRGAIDEIDELGEELAGKLLPELTVVEVVSLAADFCGVAKSDPELLECVGLSKSTFADVGSRKIPKKILRTIQQAVELEDDLEPFIKNIDLPKNKWLAATPSQGLIMLTGYVLQHLKSLAFEEVRRLNSSENLFRLFLVTCVEGYDFDSLPPFEGQPPEEK